MHNVLICSLSVVSEGKKKKKTAKDEPNWSVCRDLKKKIPLHVGIILHIYYRLNLTSDRILKEYSFPYSAVSTPI